MVSDSIPKRIIQFCHIAAEMPKEILEASRNTKKNLSDYDYILADDEAVKKLIIDEWDYRLYDWYCRNKIPASRADMARLLLVYKYGGFYIDLSMAMVTPLDAYLKKDVVLLRRDDFECYKNAPENAHFTNSIIGAPKKSDYIGLLISKMRLNFSTDRYQYDVINCTGPGLINSTIREYQRQLKVGIISFKQAKNKLFNYVRVKGFSNKWTDLQVNGILAGPLIFEKNKEAGAEKAKRLQLHFGWPKVGSTSIQDFYRDRPSEKNFYIYPVSGRPNNVRAHHQLVKHRFSGPVAESLIKESSQHQQVIISSEQGVIDSYGPDFFKGLSTFFTKFERDFTIHLYLKNIYEFIESAYAQCLRTDLFDIVKSDYDKDICSFVDDICTGEKSHILSFGKVISTFETEVGPENLNVKVVGFNIHSNDVLQDFIASNGTKEFLRGFKPNLSRSNVSLNVPEKYVLLLANKAKLNREIKFKLLNKYKNELKILALTLPGKADFSNVVNQEFLLRVKSRLDFFMPDSISLDCREYIFKEPDVNSNYVTASELSINPLVERIAADIRKLSYD